MTETFAIGAVIRLGIYMALVLVLIRLFRSLIIDAFRQNVFAIRDELFEFANQGNISFDSPAYYELRIAMNSVIRYAERITYLRFLIGKAVEKASPDPNVKAYAAKMQSLIESLPETQRAYLKTAYIRLHREIVYLLTWRSPLLLTAWLVFIPGEFIKSLFVKSTKEFSAKMQGPAEVIELEAVESRNRDLAAVGA